MRTIFILSLIFINLLAQNIVVEGEVKINGKKLNTHNKVNLGDFIETGKDSKVMFNVGKDAFLVKANSKFNIQKTKSGVKTLNVITGGVLGVFKKGSKYSIQTNNMTAGIRGTGIYIESVDNKSYFCTCYGETHVTTKKAQTTLKATHHNMIWIKPDGTIKPTKDMRNHTDNELREIEKLVGRIPEFDKTVNKHDALLRGESGY
jgi:hypothetical protein